MKFLNIMHISLCVQIKTGRPQISSSGATYFLRRGEEEINKGHYKFPYGDFENVHRCGLLAAETRAGQYKHTDIENAVAHLHGMLDK